MFMADSEDRHAAVSTGAARRMKYSAMTPSASCSQESINAVFAEQVTRTPNAVAVEFEGQTLTYRELNERANRLARYLRKLGAGVETPVGICLERSLEMIVGLLGILKAGGAYVPLDPNYPPGRLEYMLENCGARVLVTTENLLHRLLQDGGIRVACVDRDKKRIARHASRDMKELPHRHQLAYVMYTSGSTGRPKGTAIEHLSVVRLVKGAGYMEFAEREVMLQLAPVSFDGSTFEIWGALLNGGKLVVAPSRALSPREVAALVRREGITTLFLSTSLFHVLADEHMDDLLSVRQLLTGGEALLPKQARKAANALQEGMLINGYGPTENTTLTCYYRVAPTNTLDTTVPIGRPISRTYVYVLDEDMNSVTAGSEGELYAGGDGLARGYVYRPEITAEKFVPDPFSEVGGARLYRTGDRVRSLPDGCIEFLGRVDEQVKIRGYRIELGEIETALHQHADVRRAVVVVQEDVPGTKHLVAYVTPSATGTVTTPCLRKYLAENLPDFMVPAHFVFLEDFPLTPAGKIDRQALAATKFGEVGEQPRSRTGELLATICFRMTWRDGVPITSTFMGLGGSSLNATRAAAAIQAETGFCVSLVDLLGEKTLRDIAAEIEAASITDGLPTGGFNIRKRSTDGLLPASYSQGRVWFVQRMDPSNLAYHFVASITFHGNLDAVALENALNQIVERHEIYRTTLLEIDGTLYQKIHQPWKVELEVVDAIGQAGNLEQVMAQESQTPFDLTRLPLVRWRLVRLERDKHILISVEHDILHDGWTFNVFLKELTEFYRFHVSGAAAEVAPAPLQFGDFTQWQKEWMEGEEAREELEFWKKTLAGAPPVLLLPHDHPRPAIQTYRGRSPRMEISEALQAELMSLALQQRATMFMVYATAFQILLFRYSGQRDFCIGTGIANRRWRETQDLIGMLVNNIPLRLQLEGDPAVFEVLQKVKCVTLDAYSRQDVPFDKVVQELDPVRDLRYNPIFQVLFSFHDSPVACRDLPGVTVEMDAGLSNGSAKFDMNVIVIPARAASSSVNYGPLTKVLWEYNSDLFEAETIAQMMKHYVRILEEMARYPSRRISEIDVLTVEERRLLLTEWNRKAQPVLRESRLAVLFEEQVRRTPDAIAAVCDAMQLSYNELNDRANQLASYLRKMGMGNESKAGICLRRSVEMVVALIGILKAGAAYVPLDPEYPQTRLQYMIQDAGLDILVTDEQLHKQLFKDMETEVLRFDAQWKDMENECPENLQCMSNAHSLAYLMYTSGSMGQPKGVAVMQQSIVRLVWDVDYVRLGPEQTMLQLAPLTFDASTFEIWGALLQGARLILYPGSAPALDSLQSLLWSEPVSCLWLTASLFNLIIDVRPEMLAGVRQVLTGGEALSVPHIKRAQALFPDTEFINGYGPTEGTTFSCCNRVERPLSDGWETISIGRPINQTEVFILDEEMTQVPVGVTGELYIGGAGLARGYLKAPGMTAEKFVPNPFVEHGQRLYRSGDLTRWRRDGRIEFMGRRDGQVKIRGFRIELGEIEAALREFQEIREAAVLVQEDRGQKRLVAYVVLEARPMKPEELRRRVASLLPDYMVPNVFVEIEQLPLTINGKLDREALPRPEMAEKRGGFVAPRNTLEEIIAVVWAELLGADRVSVHSNFFELGGHSLLAMQLVSQLRSSLGVEIPLRCIFEHPTVAQLGERLERGAGEDVVVEVPAVQVRARNHGLPLSYAQQRLWFLYQFAEGDSGYNIPLQLQLRGHLDTKVLEFALAEIVRRHEVLRTTFGEAEGQAVQIIREPQSWNLEVVDLRPEDDAEKRALEEARRAFDLSTELPLRTLLLRTAPEQHRLVLTLHHIAGDGWSVDVLLRDLQVLYEAGLEGRPSPLTVLPVQYGDYTLWQREWLTEELQKRQLDYWKKELGNVVGGLEWPGGKQMLKPDTGEDSQGRQELDLEEQLVDDLRKLSHRRRVTLYMAVLGLFSTLLYRYTGRKDLVVRMPISGRRRTELEGLIGFFVNTLAIRIDADANTSLLELLDQVREKALRAYTNQDVPFERVVEALQPERDESGTPLVQVMVSLRQHVRTKWQLGPLEVHVSTIETGTAKFDMALILEETEEGLRGALYHRREKVSDGLARRMARNFRTLMKAAVANPDCRIGELELLTADERQQVLVDRNGEERPYPADDCVRKMLEAQVARTPDAIAIAAGTQLLTFAELDRRANQLAHRLQNLGIASESRVAICADRGLEMVIGIVGTLKAGGAYVPLDPRQPAGRLGYMLLDAGAKVMLTQAHLEPSLPACDVQRICLDRDWKSIAQESQSTPLTVTTGENAVYVIYTSGTTGLPKAVVVSDRGLANLVHWHHDVYQIQPGDHATQISVFSFDACAWEIWPNLIAGASLYIVPDEVRALAPQLPAWLSMSEISHCFMVTPLAEIVLGEWPGSVAPLRAFLIGGDVLHRPDHHSWPFPVFNHYGPTENTVVTTWEQVVEGDSPVATIGKPIANVQVYVLNEVQESAPIGVAGEVYIAGESLARGYLNRPELTAEKFMPDPFSGKIGRRLYRSGDMARWQEQGDLEFLGRCDQQVKIRGYRVEPAEVETVLLRQPGVSEAAVVVYTDAQQQKRLVAYFVGAQPATLKTDELRKALQKTLPDYMMPSALIQLEHLPLNTNGKLDRGALPSPDLQMEDKSYVPPRNEVEEIIAGIWAELLGIERASVTASFFELGGHSLLAMQVVSRIKKLFHVDLSLRGLFQSPTITGLAGRIGQLVQNRTDDQATAVERMPRDVSLPLSFNQEGVLFREWLQSKRGVKPPPISVALGLTVTGELDGGALHRAIREMVRRREILRTVYAGVTRSASGPGPR